MKNAPLGGKKGIVEKDLPYENYNETFAAADKALQELSLKTTRGCTSTPCRTSKKKSVEALNGKEHAINQSSFWEKRFNKL